MGTQANVLAQLGSDGISTGFKNRIINGAMTIDQRNAGASITIDTDIYTVDRWKAFRTQNSKYTVQQNAGSVTPPSGFTNYAGATSLSSYSVTSGDYFLFNQVIEGYNIADFGWGSASAKSVTLSFWVRSSLTGTFGGGIVNSGFNRTYPFTYTISSANTWEYKTVTIPGDTTGTWLTTTGVGLNVRFVLGCGSSRLAPNPNEWNAGGYDGPTGATSVVGTNGATWYITGVQLEVGNTATDFEYRPYGTELQLCQRYFQPAGQGSIGRISDGSSAELGTTFQVPMRAAPTLSLGGFSGSQSEIGIFGVGNKTATSLGGTGRLTGAYVVPSGWTGTSSGQICGILNGNLFSASAEL